MLMRINSLLSGLAVYGILILFYSCQGERSREITILATTDIHGIIHNYDFIEDQELNPSLASVETYVNKLKEAGESYVLLDNGDNLQGQPSVYYYNFVDTVSAHLLGEAFNFIGYDAVTLGNHDVEAGHQVYDRIRTLYDFPMLAANAVKTGTEKTYFEPFVIIKRNGLKIAVLGLVTPYIPNWLPPELYSGIEFHDMLESATRWMPEIEKKDPDLVIGLFHSGWDRRLLKSYSDGYLDENGSASVAYNVPGFDLIITGHDHNVANEKIVNIVGDTVQILDGGSRAEYLMKAEIKIESGKRENRKVKVNGSLVNLKEYKADPGFVAEFNPQKDLIKGYVNRTIGHSGKSVSTRDSYFGPSPFVGMIHTIQLKITGADISFAAPLSFDATLDAGPLTVGDMFKLYRYENFLYTMSLTGEEIRHYLEYSYSKWLSTMKMDSDNMLLFRRDKDGGLMLSNGRARLLYPPYNFDSAAGIDYIVDITREEGKRVTIVSMSDGSPFELNKSYRVAVNSYRGNGGGGHLTDGLGMDSKEMRSRLLTSTDKDLRYYFIELVEKEGSIKGGEMSNWKIVPENWVEKAKETDYRLLFGNIK